MDLGLQGRVAVVTGASRGIGLAAACALVAEGARVVAGARNSSAELDELARNGHSPTGGAMSVTSLGTLSGSRSPQRPTSDSAAPIDGAAEYWLCLDSFSRPPPRG